MIIDYCVEQLSLSATKGAFTYYTNLAFLDPLPLCQQKSASEEPTFADVSIFFNFRPQDFMTFRNFF